MTVPGAKLVGGVWLAEDETHFVEMMLHNKKRHHVEDGKATYQWHKMQACLAHLPKDRRRVCLDIGANVGQWAMWLVREFERVHCFEPVPRLADILPHNMGDATNWTLHRYALGSFEGSVALETPKGNTGNSHIVGPGDIPMRTLDSFNFEQVDFIKIDVEGYELPVVLGARETLLRCKPLVCVEQKGNDAKFYGEAKDGACAFLRALGMHDLKVISGDHIMAFPQ